MENTATKYETNLQEIIDKLPVQQINYGKQFIVADTIVPEHINNFKIVSDNETGIAIESDTYRVFWFRDFNIATLFNKITQL